MGSYCGLQSTNTFSVYILVLPIFKAALCLLLLSVNGVKKRSLDNEWQNRYGIKQLCNLCFVMERLFLLVVWCR